MWLTSGITCSVPFREISSLTHEVRDDSMKAATLVSKAFLPGAQRSKVFSGLGNNITVELHKQPAGGLATNAYVKINDAIRHG